MQTPAANRKQEADWRRHMASMLTVFLLTVAVTAHKYFFTEYVARKKANRVEEDVVRSVKLTM